MSTRPTLYNASHANNSQYGVWLNMVDTSALQQHHREDLYSSRWTFLEQNRALTLLFETMKFTKNRINDRWVWKGSKVNQERTLLHQKDHPVVPHVYLGIKYSIWLREKEAFCTNTPMGRSFHISYQSRFQWGWYVDVQEYSKTRKKQDIM